MSVLIDAETLDAAGGIEAYLQTHERKGLLRFLTCGSVDDGKSTLIGRLLHDSHQLYEDHLAAVSADSATQGSAGGELDLALLMDGLKAEREQGITIDVAYRYFSTEKRKFIIADTPGHEQYTRNMVTGASTCDLAIVLVDARHGVVTQTKRHTFLATLLGIRQIVVAVNKMDLVGFDEAAYNAIVADYLAFVDSLDGLTPEVRPIPISARDGDNVVTASAQTPWYDGPALLAHLETVKIGGTDLGADLRFPVQLVQRPDLNFRGYAGTVAAGVVAPGDDIVALPSGRRTTVARVVAFDPDGSGDRDQAIAGDAVTLTLADEIDVSRGDVLAHPDAPPRVGHLLDATLVWMHDTPMRPGNRYEFRLGTQRTIASVATLHHRIDVNTLATASAPGLELNEIGRVTLSAETQVVWDSYEQNATLGGGILIDLVSDATVAAVLVREPPADDPEGLWDARATSTLHAEASAVTIGERAARYGQQPATVLITGLANAGKSEVAQALERRLFDAGRATTVLDGQTLRTGLNKDLGFSAHDRSENLRRGAEVAKLLNDSGLVVLMPTVAASADVRARARHLIGDERFVVVHLDCPLAVCRDRDPDGLYAAADRGDLPLFPGVSFPYEPPENPDLRIDTTTLDVGAAVDAIVALLSERGFLTWGAGR